MFSNFKDAFIKKPQFSGKTPEAVLKTIGRELPDGFRYVDDHDGFCRLDCDGVMDIVPGSIRLPKEAETLFAEKGTFTMKEVMAYAYNAQKNIELTPDADGCYTVNGAKIKSSDFVVSPLNNARLEGGRMYLMAPPFPPAFPIEVAGNGYAMELMVQRQPINSIDKIKIASIGDTALSVTYILDATKPEGTMQFNIQMCSSNVAKDVLASKEIFNAFIGGTGTLCGVRITPNGCYQDKKVSDEVLRFWHRIVEVEQVLGVTFDVSQEITIDDVKTIDIMHRSFVEKLPFKEYLKDATLRGTGVFDEGVLRKTGVPIGHEILFEYIEARLLEALGVSVQCYALVDMFDATIAEIEMPEGDGTGEFFIKLLPAKDKRLFSAVQYYRSPEDLEAARKNRIHVDVFKTAEELDKY